MSISMLDSAISAGLWISIKASVLLGVAAIVHAVIYRRTSAAMRHLVWTIAIISVFLLPILSLVLPGWAVVTRTAATKAADVPAPVVDSVETATTLAGPHASFAESTGPTSTARPDLSVSWLLVIVTLYAAGVLGMLIRLTLQRLSVRRLAHEAMDVRDREWTQLLNESTARMGVHRRVRLLRSRECCIPMASGTRRPAILIPPLADTWPEDRRRAVVLHELAHVARFDCLTQSLAFAACTMYWFHPAAWWIARRLRIEREHACDDRVITAGTQARDYASHLLEIAYSLGNQRAPALAVTMARPRQLEGRMRAVLDRARNRSVPALRGHVAAAVIAAAVLLPLASATAAVVAGAPSDDRTLPTVPSSPASQLDRAAAPPWEVLEARIIESVGRIVRAAGAAIGIPQNRLPGTWELRPTDTDGTVHLRLVELNSSFGTNLPIERLEGLTAVQRTGAGGPVQFRLRRDAGTFTFEGVFRNSVGAGTFSYAPDANFAEELSKRGFARPTALEQYQLARHDIGYAFVDELKQQRYVRPQTSELVRAGQHGVYVTYLRDMGALGYQLSALEPLITLRDHGVTPAYIRELADQGYKGLPADDLRQARDHGITPEYVRAMRDEGYRALSMEQLINARDHGVTADFVHDLGEAGHRRLPLDQLIRVRDHGVSPEYVRDMRQLGYGLPVNELIRARDHGVDVEFVRGMSIVGYSGASLDSLVRLRDHGVTPKHVEELKALGYEGLPVDDLVTLRDHGLTTDRIRAANTRAGTRLPVDRLKRLAVG